MAARSESSFVQKTALSQAQKSAWKEIRWFYETMGGRVPKMDQCLEWEFVAAQAIHGWLRRLPSFNTGAFSLRYLPQKWPPAVTKRFTELTGLVVRIECAQHPSDGHQSDEDLEKASVARLEAMLADRRAQSMLYDLDYRAYWHLRAAHKAYVKVRGNVPCVLADGIGRKLAGDVDE
jgi:hypothetical protein